MRGRGGRGRGRGASGNEVAKVIASSGQLTNSMAQEAEEDAKLPPPDFPDLWVDGGYKFQAILPCVVNEPYKARMAIKIQNSSKGSPFYLEPDEPVPEIQTWMTRNMVNAKPIKKKPSEIIEFSEQLFPFELLPKKIQNNIKKEQKKRKRYRTDDDILFDIQKQEKEGITLPDSGVKLEKEGSQSGEEKVEKSGEENEENEEKDIEEEEEEDPLGDIDAVWKHNDDDSLGEEEASDDETFF